jgi:hypothetical protein
MLPNGSAEPWTMSVGWPIAARSSGANTSLGDQPDPATTRRTIARSWRIAGESLLTATRHAMNSSGIRPASRLGPWPLSRRIERVRSALIGRRTMSAPRGDASSPMNAGRATSLTTGPPPISTRRSTRSGARWARLSAQTSPIDVPTIEAEASPAASSTPARMSAVTSWKSCAP